MAARKAVWSDLTNRDLRFENNLDRPIADIMTRDPLFTVPVGTKLEQAREILHRHKVEKLLVVDDRFMLKGLITVKDIQKSIKYPKACKDSLGRLRAGGDDGAALPPAAAGAAGCGPLARVDAAGKVVQGGPGLLAGPPTGSVSDTGPAPRGPAAACPADAA